MLSTSMHSPPLSDADGTEGAINDGPYELDTDLLYRHGS